MGTAKVVYIFLCLEAAAEYLHAEEGEYEDEEDEEDEQGVDRGDRVHQGLHQVSHRRPVSEMLNIIYDVFFYL